MGRTIHGQRTKGGSTAKLTHNCCIFGIMGGTAPLTGVPLAHRAYLEKRAARKALCIKDCAKGHKYLKDNGILGCNPQAGGVGNMWRHRHYSSRWGPTPPAPQPLQCQLPPLKNNQTMKIIDQSNIQLLTQNPPPKNVYYVVTEAVSSNNALFVDPTSTLCISSGGSIDLSQSTYGMMAGEPYVYTAKLSASDIYNCGTLTLGDIGGGYAGIYADTLNLINNGTLTLGDISGFGIDAHDALNLTNNGTLTLGVISSSGKGIYVTAIVNLTNNGTLTLGVISGGTGIYAYQNTLNLTNNGTLTLGDIISGGIGINAATLNLTNNETLTLGDIISGGIGLHHALALNVWRKGRICVGNIDSSSALSAPDTLTPSTDC